MKKNIIIIVLVVLVVMFGLYGFAQKVKADDYAEKTRVQRDAAIATQMVADEQRVLAEEQMLIAVAAQDMAVSLQQQLDKCK